MSGIRGEHLARFTGQELAIEELVGARHDLQFRRRCRVSSPFIEPRQEVIERLRRPSSGGAAMHQGRVRGDASQPGPELRLAAERRQMTIDLEERLLQARRARRFRS